MAYNLVIVHASMASKALPELRVVCDEAFGSRNLNSPVLDVIDETRVLLNRLEQLLSFL